MKLWNLKTAASLHTFRCTSIVNSVAFHPTDDSYFISGGIDGTFKLWQLPDAKTVEWVQLPNRITLCKYTPAGDMYVIGLDNGDILFYIIDGFHFYNKVYNIYLRLRIKK